MLFLYWRDEDICCCPKKRMMETIKRCRELTIPMWLAGGP